MGVPFSTGFRQHPAGGGAPPGRSCPTRLWRMILPGAGAVLFAIAPAFAQRTGEPEPMELLARAWAEYYSAKPDYAKVVQVLGPLANWPESHVREEAQHCAARASWSSGTRQGQDRARAIWVGMERAWSRRAAAGLSAAGDSTGRRVLIGQAVMLAGEGKTAEAIKVLEPLTGFNVRQWSDPAVAESAILLCDLYCQGRQFDEARRAVDFGEAYITAQLGPGGELNATITGPFTVELRAARRRLEAVRKEVLFPGRVEFEAAEKLRASRKFQDALQAYRAVIANHPDTIYAANSGYCIGLCLVGLERPADAIRWWERHISEGPAGGFRAQSALGVIDASLEEFLDLEKADACGKRALASLLTVVGSAPISELDKQIKESWQVASADLHLRLGLLALLKNDHLAAGDALGKARAAAVVGNQRSMLGGLDVLIEAAKEKQPLLPADVASAAGPSERAALALAMGRIYQLTGRAAQAEGVYGRVLDRKVAGVSAAQTAFALFCRARMLQGRGTSTWNAARDGYLDSIRAFKAGSWHDESLFSLAELAEAEARNKFGALLQPPAPRKDKDGKVVPEASKTKAQVDQAAKDKRDGELKWLEARAAALPYWRELVSRYPASPRVEDALFRSGTLLADLEQWKEAASVLDRAVRGYPNSDLAGGAYLKLIDVHLEELFEIGPAREYATSAVAWADSAGKVPPPSSPAAEPGSGRDGVGQPGAPAAPAGLWSRRAAVPAAGLAVQRYEVYLRAGLIAYLDGRHVEAVRLFELARPLEPKGEHKAVAGRVPSGIERLIESARQRRRLTPVEVATGDGKAGLILQLADAYRAGGQFEPAYWLYWRVTDGGLAASREQQSWGRLNLGRSLYGQQHSVEDVLSEYEQAVRLSPRSAWSGEALFLSGNIRLNHFRDVNGAVELWRRLLRDHPHSGQAERASLYIATAYDWSGRPALAAEAYRDALARHPAGAYATLIRGRLAALEARTAIGAGDKGALR